MRRATNGTFALLTMMLAAVFLGTVPSTGFAQSLGGVSCDDVMTNGVLGDQASPLGTTPSPLLQPLPQRSGFDYLNSWTWVRNASGDCPTLLNEFFICVETAGRWGDADGDGAPWSQAGPCSNHPAGAFPPGADGAAGDAAAGIRLASFESHALYIDRDCAFGPDLVFLITGGTVDPQLVVEQNDGPGPVVGTVLGGLGVAYAYTPTETDAYGSPCPNPADVRGHVLLRIPNWDAFFAAEGLNPGQFIWTFDNGNDRDQVAEDYVGGTYNDFFGLLDIVKTPDLNLCVGTPGELTVTVTNNGNATVYDITLTDLLPDGWDFTGIVSGGGCVTNANQVGNLVTFTPAFDLAPCEECTVVFEVTPTADCVEGDNTASVEGVTKSYCAGGGDLLAEEPVGPETDSSHLVCLSGPCVVLIQTAHPDTACYGEPIELSATVENCSDAVEDIQVCIAGQCTTFANVASGARKTFTVTVDMPPCSPTAPSCFDVTYRAQNDCGTDEGGTTEICVYCGVPEVDITKDNGLGPEECVPSPGTATFTLVVTNTGPTDLTEITVTDEIDCDYAGYVADSADPTPLAAPPANGNGILTWTAAGPLAPGESLTFTYQVAFAIPEDECPTEVACPNTATVDAYCADQLVSDEASEETCIVCEGGEACPRTIGFWRQQCAQKGNGSTKVCLEGMYGLWDCVLDETGVLQWRKNDGSFETTASLIAASDAQRFERLCSQLQGPRPMTLFDMAELQYLGLMLNICSGALPASTPIDNGMFTGTVAELVEGIENALNTGVDLGYWKTLVDDTNNRIGVLAGDCLVDPIRNLPACVDGPVDAQSGSLFEQGLDMLLMRAVPNPSRDEDVRIQFRVPSASAGAFVELAVYDVAGRLVRNLLSETRNAGDHQASWDLTDNGGNRVSAGIYFYRLRVGGEMLNQKLLITR